MAILVEEGTLTSQGTHTVFHLQTNHTSYVMAVPYGKYLAHVYWGKKIRTPRLDNALLMRWICFDVMEPLPAEDVFPFSLDYLRQEFSTEQNGDYRIPSVQVEYEDGSRCCSLIYDGYEIKNGKDCLEGLPSVYTQHEKEAQTLEIRLRDEWSGLMVCLSYVVMENWDVITRSVRIENPSEQAVRINRISSACVDFEDSDWDMISLPGAWGHERHIERQSLRRGCQLLSSVRGASSHQMNPFLALARRDVTEEHGEVYAMNLVYSGNFHAGVEVDQIGSSRMFMGLGDDDFSWLLEPRQSFTAPEVVLVYSDEGLGGMSRIYHRLYRKRVVRGKYRDQIRPILVNNWEATYFDFDEEKIVDIAREAASLGIELMVLDDGWFGKRNADTSSLGDWVANQEKLPNGLSGLAQRIRDCGVQFGLWVEPEMVSVDSDMYRAHPDWCIHVKGRERKECRNQLTLDLCREEVCDYLIQTIGGILDHADISYVKWDMNRHMSHIGSESLPKERQREVAHRYMLGLYRVMETITQSHPDVLFESCSGGGGRFDPGMLYYMPQTWTSDDTDPVERLYIQYGTSLAYPISTMGAHISAVPNHQSGRITPLKMRGDVAMSGNFGYELDLTQFTKEEKEEVRSQIADYKKLRSFVQSGDLYRTASPFEGNLVSWNVVSEDKKEVFGAFFRIQSEVNPGIHRMKFAGLEKEADYTDEESGQIYSGDELMRIGLVVDFHGDYQSRTWHLKRI